MISLLHAEDLYSYDTLGEIPMIPVIPLKQLPSSIQDKRIQFKSSIFTAVECVIDSISYAFSTDSIAAIQLAADAVQTKTPLDYLSFDNQIIPIRKFGCNSHSFITVLHHKGSFMGVYCNDLHLIEEFIYSNTQFEQWCHEKPQRLHFLFK